jgi:hypothetical protein
MFNYEIPNNCHNTEPFLPLTYGYGHKKGKKYHKETVYTIYYHNLANVYIFFLYFLYLFRLEWYLLYCFPV